MTSSPLTQMKPKIALLHGSPESAGLDILLNPFFLDSELVDTAIRLDNFSLPSLHLRELIGRTFIFPSNPADGFIDGSIYLENTHHPVDVTTLAFHLARDGGVSVVVKGQIDFASGCDNVSGQWPFAFGVRVATCAV